MNVFFTARARERIRELNVWWRENRRGAPNLLDEEIDEALGQILVQPHLGFPWRAVGGMLMRRVLLKKTRQWLYYSVENNDQIIVHTVWGTPAWERSGTLSCLATGYSSPIRPAWEVRGERHPTAGVAACAAAALCRERGAAWRPVPNRPRNSDSPLADEENRVPHLLRDAGRRAARELSSMSMTALRAHVEKGRIVLDDPMDFPDGTALEVDGLRVVNGDGIPASERPKILQAIDEGLSAARRGEHVDAEEFINELLSEP